jgi:hypothetical protein
MLQRLIFLAALCALCNQAFAVCPPHRLSKPAEIRLTGSELMIVTHATSTHDARFSAKRGVDEAVRFAKDRGIPVIYLADDTPEKFYYMEDCQPDYWAFSQGGEIGFAVPPAHLYIVGGHLELCLSATLHDVIYQWAQHPPRNLTITYFMDAIYSNGKLIDPSDPFYSDFQRFMGVVTYGRPGGEHWPKLTLLETLGVIKREDHELEYLKQALPRWDTTFPPQYRIELQLNHSVKKVLRPAPGWNPPTVLFHFVDSALNLASPSLQ